MPGWERIGQLVNKSFGKFNILQSLGSRGHDNFMTTCTLGHPSLDFPAQLYTGGKTIVFTQDLSSSYHL
jgi:hypothetical protein